MKKIFVLISAVAFLIVLASSCTSSSKCAAYGESQKYQKESRY